MSNGIFVTVGTHEQPFSRLLLAVESLTDGDGRLGGLPVFAQHGTATRPPSLAGEAMLTAEAFGGHIGEARLVVTHGGPGSILAAVHAGRPTVLVPRQKRFGEHVDDHQVAFCRRVAEEYGLPCVEDISALGGAIRLALSASDASRPAARSDSSRQRAVGRLAQQIAGLFEHDIGRRTA